MKSAAVIAEIKKCCILEGYCLREYMVYEAKVLTKDNFKLYQEQLLNKRNEIISKCRHRSKYLIKNAK